MKFSGFIFILLLFLLLPSLTQAQKVTLKIRVVYRSGIYNDNRIFAGIEGVGTINMAYKKDEPTNYNSYEIDNTVDFNSKLNLFIWGFQKRCLGIGGKSNGDYWQYKPNCFCGDLGLPCGQYDDIDKTEYKITPINSVEHFSKVNDIKPNTWFSLGEISSGNNAFIARLEGLWLPNPQSIVVEGEKSQSKMVCGDEPFRIKADLESGAVENVNFIWQTATIRTRYVDLCICSGGESCRLQGYPSYTVTKGSGCPSGWIKINNIPDPNGAVDTVWTDVSPIQTGPSIELKERYNPPSTSLKLGFPETKKYRFFVKNGNKMIGPSSVLNMSLYPPAPTNAEIKVIPILCKGANNGEIQISKIEGEYEYYGDYEDFNKYGTYTASLREDNSEKTWSEPELNKLSVVSFTNLPPGNYTLKIFNALNLNEGGKETCALERKITITEPAEKIAFANPAYTSSNYNGYGITCHGASDGRIEVNGTGGTGAYRYSIDNVNFQESRNFANLNAGTYSLYLRDQNGCMPDQPAIAVLSTPTKLRMITTPYEHYQNTHIKCAGDSSGLIRLITSGGVSPYRSSINGSAEVQGKLLYDQLKAGTYNILLKDQNNCTVQSSTTLNEPLALALSNTNVQNPKCYGSSDGAIAFNITGGILYKGTGYSIELTNPQKNIQNSSATAWQSSNLSAGVYQFSIKDDYKCELSSPITLIEPEELIIQQPITYHDVPCKGESTGYLFAIAQGGTAPYSYEIKETTKGQTIPLLPQGLGVLANNLPQGTYSIRVSDSKGCQLKNASLQKIAEPAAVLAMSIEPTLPNCYGYSDGKLTIKPTGGWGTYTYSIGNQSMSTQSSFTGLKSGNYTLTLQDKQNCRATMTIMLNQPPLLVAKINSRKDPLCFGDNSGMATITTQGGTKPYSFAQSTTALFQADSNFTGLKQGTYTFQIKDSKACTDTARVTLSQPKELILRSQTIINSSCGKPNGTAIVKATGGTPTYKYTWTFDPRRKDSVISNVVSGAYYAIVTDQHNCQDTTMLYINDEDGPMVKPSTTKSATCSDRPDGAAAVLVSGGYPPYTYLWPSNAGSAASTEVRNIYAGSYSVEATDSRGCKGSAIVTVGAPLPITVQIDTLLAPNCAKECNGKISIKPSGGTAPYSYQWKEHTENSRSRANLCAGSYTIMVIDKNQCTEEESITLSDPLDELNLGDSAVVCQGQKVNLEVPIKDAQYYWTSNNGFESRTQKVTLQSAGEYVLKVINNRGCLLSDTFRVITSSKLLKAHFLMSGKAYAYDTINIIEYSWPMPENITWTFPKEIEVIREREDWQYVKLSEPGSYKVKLSVQLGECKDELEKEIIVISPESAPIKNERLGFRGIEDLVLFPNPNTGAFTVDVVLSEVMDISLEISNIYQSSPLHTIKQTGSSSYHIPLQLLTMAQGTYYIKVKTERDSKMIKFIVQ